MLSIRRAAVSSQRRIAGVIPTAPQRLVFGRNIFASNPQCALRTYSTAAASTTNDEHQTSNLDATKSFSELPEDLSLVDPNTLPPVPVTTSVARCDGDVLNNLGHPAEFIRVRFDKPERCKYCGVRYIRVHGGHHGH